MLFISLFYCTSCTSENEEERKSSIKLATDFKDTIIDQFSGDSLWYKIYGRINRKVTRPILMRAMQKVSDEHSIELPDLGLLFFVASNLDSAGFTSDSFKLRYPFANDSAVLVQYSSLSEVGLIEGDTVFHLSEKATYILTTLIQDISKQDFPILSNDEVQFLIGRFGQIKNEAIKPGFNGNYPSLIERSKASIQPMDSCSNQLRLILLMDDLVTMRNDASHYRMNHVQSFMDQAIDLSPEAIEILAASSFSSPFYYERFSKRPTWGHSEKSTQVFIDELIDQRLAIKQADGGVELTKKGQELQELSAHYTEKVFYEPWLGVYDDYNSLMDVVSDP